LDLRPAVLAAWEDGVRVFVEHGPRGTFGRAIRGILGEREALIVSLDRKGQGIDATLGAVAALLAAGVAVRHEIFGRAPVAAKPSAGSRTQRIAAHPPGIVIPRHKTSTTVINTTLNTTHQIMAPAPKLPSVLDEPASQRFRVATPARRSVPAA